MKKLLFIALLSVQFLQAQEAKVPDSVAIANRKNEFRIDVLSMIVYSEFNLTYERFLDEDFSVGVFGGFSNSNSKSDDFDSGHRNNLPKYEINPFMRYNLSKSPRHFYFAEVFLSVNGGDFKETVRKIDDAGDGYYVNEKSTYSDLGIGAALGYKMYIDQKFAIEFLVGFGTNIFNTDQSPDTISRVGLSFGYRF
jgi:hypothetical protein